MVNFYQKDAKIIILFVTLILLTTFSLLSGEEAFERPNTIEQSEGSVSELRTQKEENPNDVQVIYSLAWRQFDNGSYSQAIEGLREALKLRPKSPFIYYKMGIAFKRSGKTDSAKKYLEKAVESHYEYIEAWQELVKIAPNYYFNLGMLYQQKAESLRNIKLAQKGKEYLKSYLDKTSDPSYAEEAQGSKESLTYLIKSIKSSERKEERKLEAKKEARKLRQKRRKKMRQFRRNEPYVIGFGVQDFNPAAKLVFHEKQDILEDSLLLEDITNTTFGYLFSGGMFKDAFILRGQIFFGKGNSTQDFLKDTIRNKQDSLIKIQSKVESANITLVQLEVAYNFFYRNPLLLNVIGDINVGSMSLNTGETQYFEGHSIAGVGGGIGAMFRLESFLIGLNFKYNAIGSSKSSNLNISVYYKF